MTAYRSSPSLFSLRLSSPRIRTLPGALLLACVLYPSLVSASQPPASASGSVVVEPPTTAPSTPTPPSAAPSPSENPPIPLQPSTPSATPSAPPSATPPVVEAMPAEPAPAMPPQPAPAPVEIPVVAEPVTPAPPVSAQPAPAAHPPAQAAPAKDPNAGLPPPGSLESNWVHRPEDDAAQRDADLTKKGEQPLGRVRFTFSAGYFYGGLDHPLMAKSTAHGGMMEFDFGLLGTKRWGIGLALQASAMPLREVDGKYVRKGVDADEAPTQMRASCETCTPAAGGGKVLIREALMTSVMPRVEFTPMGRTGPFVAVGGGVGTVNMRGMRVGGALDARTGFRYAAADRLSFGASLGFHAVMANDARAWIPFAAAEIRMN